MIRPPGAAAQRGRGWRLTRNREMTVHKAVALKRQRELGREKHVFPEPKLPSLLQPLSETLGGVTHPGGGNSV